MEPIEFRTPRKITDLAEYAEDYIAFIRAAPHNSVSDVLVDYVHCFFRDVAVNRHQLCWLAIMFVDRIYRSSANLLVRDGAAIEYFSRVTRYVLDVLASQGIRVLYILDNEMRRDRFDLCSELLRRAGLSVVTAYTESQGPVPYEEVQRELEIELGAGRHVAYIEMDATVNYLEPVIAFARNTNRLVVFRNRAASHPNVEHIPSQGVAALTS